MPKPKRERIRTEKQVQRKLKDERRGSLEGEYKPFLLIHDFTSHGRVSRIKYNNREVHLMSDLETAVFQELMWHPDVVDIREQFPLDRAETMQIADEMNVNHPKLRGDGGLMPLTSDFVVDFRFGPDKKNGPIVRRAVAVKPTSSLRRWTKETPNLSNTRATNTIDKLEIERRYWAKQNCAWFLITDEDLCMKRKVNIELLLGTEDPCDHEADLWMERLMETYLALLDRPKARICELYPPFMHAGNLPSETVVRAVRLLCKYQFLEFDMSRVFSPAMTASQFTPGPSVSGIEADPAPSSERQAA